MLFADGEIVTALLGVGVLAFAVSGRRRLMRLPHPRLLVGAFTLLLAGWLVTVGENLGNETVLNTVEHVCYLLGALASAAWCLRASREGVRAA